MPRIEHRLIRAKPLVFMLLFIVVLQSASLVLPVEAKVTTPIKHVVVIMQENRTFDNFFWTYPGVMGGAGTNSTYCVPTDPNMTGSNCYSPMAATALSGYSDLPHSYNASMIAYNGGAMNGFLANTVSTKNPNGNLEAISYYDNQTIPYYWFLADHFTLADQFYSSVTSYSQPNHWYMLAGASPATSIFSTGPMERTQVLYDIPYSSNGQVTEGAWTVYLNQSQTIQTIVDQLSSSKVSWKYYDSPIPATCKSLLQAIAVSCKNVNPYDYWNPLEAKNSSYTEYASHFKWRGQILTDIQNGGLPAVSWVIPAGAFSDHPPANVTLGEYWVTDVVNAIEDSQYWKNTMIVVMWDDFGGFFDVMKPPVVPQYGLGFRAPALIISPYSRQGIDNNIYSFESTLKFIDDNWGISPLNARVAAANDISTALNFNQSPIPPITMPLSQAAIGAISGCFRTNTNCGSKIQSQGAGPVQYVNITASFIDGDDD